MTCKQRFLSPQSDGDLRCPIGAFPLFRALVFDAGFTVLTPVFNPVCTDKLVWPCASLALSPWAHAEAWASTQNPLLLGFLLRPLPLSLVAMIRVCTAHSVRKTKPDIDTSSRSLLLQDLCPATTYWHAPPHIAPPPSLTRLPHHMFPPELYAVSSRMSVIMVGYLASH